MPFWNTALFLLLNAASRPGPMLQGLVVAVAGAPVLLAPVLLACLWVWGPPARRAALIAAGAGVFAGQGINLLIGLVWFDPRPFMGGSATPGWITWRTTASPATMRPWRGASAWGLPSPARPAAGAPPPA